MEYKKEKWEIQYEKYQNGGLDKAFEELETKKSNKEIDIKEYVKQEKQLNKIKDNLPMVGHLVENRAELLDLKNEIENEILLRRDEKIRDQESKLAKTEMKKLDVEMENLLKNIDATKEKLKDKTLSESDREALKEQLSKDESGLKQNKEKYSELNRKRSENSKDERTSDISKMDKDDLKTNYRAICMKLSRNNFFGKRLIKGYNIENIKEEDKNINWTSRKYDIDVKKLVANRENAKKLQELKETSKSEIVNENDDKQIQEQIGKNVRKIMDEQEEKSLVKADEFAQKHPRLAKIRDFFTNMKNKIFTKDDGGDIEEKEEKEEKKTEENKTEKKEENKRVDKHKSFVNRLKDMNEYDIVDIAEKGYQGLENEKMNEAKKKLQEAKIKSAEESKAKYEQGFNDYYKSHGINKTKTDNTNYMSPSTKDNDAR